MLQMQTKKRISYVHFLARRGKPITSQDSIGEWFAKLTAARRRKLTFLHKQQNGLCWYCDEPTTLPEDLVGKDPLNMATLDHLIPQVKGGTDSLKNLVCACGYCNSRRGTTNPQRFRNYAKRVKAEHIEAPARQEAKRLEKLANPKKQLAYWRFFMAIVLLSYDEHWNAMMQKHLVD